MSSRELYTIRWSTGAAIDGIESSAGDGVTLVAIANASHEPATELS